MKVRLADVAARAEVSEATVSRVLNNRPGVSPESRQAVLRVIEMLGYERRPRLSGRHTDVVGMILPELTNPVFPLIAQTMETALADQGFASVLCTQVPGGLHEDDYIAMLLEHNASGIVFVSGMHANSESDSQRYRNLREQGMPIVLVNGYVLGVDAPFFSTDDAHGIDLAVHHLAQLGHRRIGMAMGPSRYIPVQRKIAGFEVAMRRHVDSALTPPQLEELIVTAVFSLDGGREATQALLERGVTGVICGSDLMAFGALRAARERGLKVPQDLSIIGADGIDFGEFCDPPLTTLAGPNTEMAVGAVRALMQEIGGDPAPRAEYMFRPELVVRGSTGRARHRRNARNVGKA